MGALVIDEAPGKPHDVLETAPRRSLLPLVAAGNATAFEDLYDLYSPTVYGILLRISGDAEEASDLLQETFVHAWQKAARYDSARGSEIAWLITIARTRAIDRIRSRGTRRIREDEAAREISTTGASVENVGTADAAELRETREMVVAALAELPPEQRQVIELAYFEGKSHSEIAEHLGQPLGSVKTRIQLGMKKLRTRLVPMFRWDTNSTKI